GKAIERALSAGQKHSYEVALLAGQYLRVQVAPTGIDVGVNLQLPGGQIINQFVPFGDQSDLTFSWVAAASGLYRTTVYATAKAPAGSYVIRIAELRAATDTDLKLQQARDLFQEYVRLKHQEKYVEARAPLLRALEIREKVLGPDNLAVAETL